MLSNYRDETLLLSTASRLETLSTDVCYDKVHLASPPLGLITSDAHISRPWRLAAAAPAGIGVTPPRPPASPQRRIRLLPGSAPAPAGAQPVG